MALTRVQRWRRASFKVSFPVRPCLSLSVSAPAYSTLGSGQSAQREPCTEAVHCLPNRLPSGGQLYHCYMRLVCTYLHASMRHLGIPLPAAILRTR
ncbi:hypothetical protein EDB80DRAFT_737320 [Ilyonectria destructans]|nr:hypothetical protein BKA56DRAFT_241477 [Ilyonectria sp. MPI-CAGE-AT-0026]KAH6981478.1 hypothetical protein EDB80DRAFT_737320 [Ilyonectria destructans]